MGKSELHSRSEKHMRSAVVLCALWLCAFLSLNPTRALADLGDNLETQYQDLQKVTAANVERITNRQIALDDMSRRVSRSSPDYQALQNSIIELKLKTNEMFEKKSDIATQLKNIGRDPDYPNSKPGPSAKAGMLPGHPMTTDAAPAYKPLQKEDGGEVASADVSKLAHDLIPPKPVVVATKPTVVFNPQIAPAPTVDNSKSIASVIVPKPDPVVEAEIDDKVKRQKPDVDVLMKLASGLPEPPPAEVAAAPIPAPVESPQPQAVQTPGVDWTSIIIGTALVGGAIAAGVAASSIGGGGGGYSPCH